jgi:uncharacterized protein YbjT (DUF2867 family)
MIKRILVIGATGNQGRSVIAALRKHPGFSIRALVRNPASETAKRLVKEGVELIEGDLDDRKSLETAMANAYGVFSYQNMADGVTKEEERGKRVAHVVKQLAIPHLVYSSVGGADRNSDVSYFLSKRRIEDFIRELDLTNYTILRPVAFMDNFASGYRDLILSFFKSALKGKPIQMIAVADIGKWVAHVFSQFDPFQFQELEIAGDELTYGQIEAAYEKVEGKKPGSVPIPGALLSKFGDTGKLYTWMLHEGYQADLTLCRKTITDSLTFEQWLSLKHRGLLP